MQTRKISLVLVSFLFSFSVLAQKQNYAVVNDNNPPRYPSFDLAIAAGQTTQSFQVRIDNPERKKLRLIINHKLLGIVVDTVITDAVFNRGYSLENAEDGEYVILLRSGKERIRKEIAISTEMRRNLELH